MLLNKIKGESNSSKYYLNAQSALPANKDLVAARFIIESWSVARGPGQQGWQVEASTGTFGFCHPSLYESEVFNST